MSYMFVFHSVTANTTNKHRIIIAEIHYLLMYIFCIIVVILDYSHKAYQNFFISRV